MIKVGDKVKFLNDVGGGVVTGFINKNTVNVEGDDGFEVPCLISELVNVSAPELNAGTVQPVEDKVQDKSAAEPEFIEEAGEIINGKNSPDFYFCFVPTDSKNPLAREIEMYLVNDSNFTVLFSYSHIKAQSVEIVEHGTVKSNSRIKLDALVQNDLSDLPDFGFQLIYFRNSDNEWNQPVVKQFRVNPVKFYKESTFLQNSYFRTNAIILQITPDPLKTELDKLTQADFKKVVKSKEIQQKTKQKLRKRTTEEVVIDLHINELLDNSEGLSNREILEIQMETVAAEMNTAIKGHVKRIVFIHGVGQGVLKQEVANLLKRKFKKYYFQDASFKEYGYGATMVILRK
uniref:Smr/MutS family protein n=1 Tax=uncultured Draconibacterium sp. TaxID=1573823 RepID=UPI003216E35D